MKRVHLLVLPELHPVKEFGQLQESCPTLTGPRYKANSGEKEHSKHGSTFIYLRPNGLLYRKCVSFKHTLRVGKFTLVVPKDCRPIILSVGHENPLAGHFSHRKTTLKINDKFF